MLESLVTWVLNNYVGDYLENLNTDHISVALLSGQVELENVPLKQSALRKLDLPLTVKSGVLGKLTLSVPVTRVRSEAWTLRLSDVLVLLGPESSCKYDAEVEEAGDQTGKQSQLDELEKLHHSELAQAMGLTVPSEVDNSWWGASLLSTVLNNIQLIISNVHIRYEDSTSIGGRSFCAGVRIQNVVVQTTNHRWKPGFVEPVEGANVFKKLELKGFSFYWNSGESLSPNVKSVKEIQSLLSPENMGTNSYVVAPCCIELRMEKNTSKLPLKEKMPRFKFLLRPETIALELSGVQMRDMRAVTREWARFERARPHRKWRPEGEIHEHAKEWWIFAKNRIVAEGKLDSFRRTWSFALSRAHHLNVYARAYKRRLLSLVHSALPPPSGEAGKGGETKEETIGSKEDKMVMRQIERDAQYSFNELSIIRDVVFSRLIRENRIDSGQNEEEEEVPFESINTEEIPIGDGREQAAGGGGLYAWMTSFFSSAIEEGENEDKKYDFGIDLSELRSDLPSDLREKEKEMDKELLEVLHDSWDDSTLLRKDYLLADIAMRIDHITLRLVDSNGSSSCCREGRVMAVDLMGVSCQVEVSPRTHSISLSLSVHDVSLQRLQMASSTPSGEEEDSSLMYSLAEYTNILFAMGRDQKRDEEGEALFKLFYKRRSIQNVRHSIEASFRPLAGMYDKDAFAGLIALFSDGDVDEEMDESEEAKRKKRVNARTNTQVNASIRFPAVKLEVRKCGEGLIGRPIEGEESKAIATLVVEEMMVVVESKEEEVTQTRISIGHIELEDNMEGSPHPLLTTKTSHRIGGDTHTSSLSSSWPQLHTSSTDDSSLSTSLPHSNGRNNEKREELNERKTSTVVENCRSNEVTVLCTMYGETMTENKRNMSVEVEMNGVEMGMSRRSWSALLDIMGVIGVEEKEKNDQPKGGKKSSMEVSLRLNSFIVHMEYPGVAYRLGSLVFDDFTLSTITGDYVNEKESMTIDAAFSSLTVVDRSPHSIQYDTRMVLSGERTKMRIVKYGRSASDDCDMRVGLESGETTRLIYTHTHRYLCALMDFWCQFTELHDLINKSRQEKMEQGGRARVLIDFKLPCMVDIVIPRSYQDERTLVLSAKGVRVHNSMEMASSLCDLLDELCLESEDETGIDCLLDKMQLMLTAVTLHDGIRREPGVKPLDSCNRLLDFSTFCVEVSPSNFFSIPIDLEVTALRNLSNEESHAIPDMSFLITMRRFRWEMSSRFFKLLRGILELNLGEPLIPSPETIPIEILSRPALTVEVGSDKRYQTLSIRIQLEEVVAECSIGVGEVDEILTAPLCTIHFVQARLSFDASTDGQAEIDLICERATIVDRREGGVREEYGYVLSPLDTNSTKLMGEAHLMLRKDESPLLTVVIVNARIIVVPDLLNDIKDFILISPHDIPSIPDCGRCQSGVINRTSTAPPIAPPQGPPNHIKLTMRDSSLIFLEKPLERDSLALIAHTTTVLQMTEHGGNVNATLEIQGMSFSWCTMNEEWHRSVFSNEFSASVDLQMARDVSQSGLSAIPSLIQPKIELGTQLVGLICKVSPLDVGALLDISTNFASFMTTKQRSLFTKPPDAGIAIGRISLQCEEGHVWVQDELNGSSLPLLRVSAYNVNLSKECDRLKSSLSFSADFFNQRLFGWEPLIERWNILRFTSVKKEQNTSMELIAETLCTLDISLSEQLISQCLHLKESLPRMKEAIENKVYRNGVVGGTAHHMAYVLKNSTECTLTFSTGVDEILSARTEQRKSVAKWLSVSPGSSLHFEFPTILLFYSASQREPPRQLIVRVKGWDETSPINVDASGTYFRVIKALEKDTLNARIVIRVSMEKDGRKQIEVSSSVRVSNQLPHSVELFEISTKRKLATIDSSSRVFIPLRDAHLSFDAFPIISEKEKVSTPARIMWSGVKTSGKTVHSTHCLTSPSPQGCPFWLCCSIRRERYPEGDSLPGHYIRILPPLTLQSLLPIDAHITVSNYSHLVKAGKNIKITSVNISDEISIRVETDRLSSSSPLLLSPSDLSSSTDMLIPLSMRDEMGRTSSFFITAKREMGGSISISLWSPFWVLNKTGIPLIIKQDASECEWAGQGEEHEKANDKHPLLFDLADDRFPPKCAIRLGADAVREEEYRPVFCKGITLSPGVQSIQLLMRHESLPTRYYNIGVEVRPGTGLYKDTQVVLLTSRFIINNASSFQIVACHVDLLEQQSRHISISPQSTVIWNENRSSCSLLCIKRSDASNWSSPFRIDTIHSNHVTMRAVDDTPLFLRVEVTLHGSVFHVTISDAHYCPAPIVIDNQSEVPVLYQQMSRNPDQPHLRTICKAKSKVEYAWDDPSDVHQLNLQVYEKKSVMIDPSKIGKTATLTYDNAFYITIVNSFQSWCRDSPPMEKSQLVLECLQKGKVVLNKQNRVDANSGSQLWRWNGDRIENVGMSIRCSTSYVLDTIDGCRAMVTQKTNGRDETQKWRLREDSRLVSERGRKAIVGRVSSLEVTLEDVDENKDEQLISLSRMRPGSGCLHVNTVHEGPSLVVRIVDEEDSMVGIGRPSLSSLLHPHPPSFDINLQLTSGIGLSLVSGSHEELLYLRLSGLQVYGKKSGESLQLTASVDQIQMDNQLISSSDQSTVLSCRSEHLGGDSIQSPLAVRPALKLEMNCTPFKHYDSFDVFRIRLSPLSLRLDEILLWKVVHLINSCRSSNDSQLHLTPPDTNLTRPNAANARRCYFGTLDLQFGSADLSVVTVSKSSLPIELRLLKDQYNVTLISFEKAKISLPAFRQLHYFETSSFLLENIGNFYLSELRKQTISIIVSLDAFGNPQGLASDLKDSFAGLFIEGDVQRFITGIGYGVSNSVSKIASSASAGVGAITFDNEHEERRSGRKWAKTSDSALSHLYGGVKGLGVGVLGGMTAIVSNTITESKRNGILKGTLLGLTTGAVDTITKPVQGVFDFVEGTASAIKHASSPSSRRIEGERLRPPRVTTGLYGLLPPYSESMARAQMELMRINGHKWNEKLLDVEVCLEQISERERLVRHYVLLSCTQAYVCKQEGDVQSVLQRIPYAMMKNAVPMSELPNSFASIELGIENDQGRENKVHLWCSRFDVARRLADKLMRAKYYYDHVKRSISDVNEENVEQGYDSIIDY